MAAEYPKRILFRMLLEKAATFEPCSIDLSYVSENYITDDEIISIFHMDSKTSLSAWIIHCNMCSRWLKL